MHEISDFLAPVPSELFQEENDHSFIPKDRIHTAEHVPSLEGASLALLTIEEERGSIKNQGCAHGGNAIRKSLYTLHPTDREVHWIDLGIIKAGSEYSDTCFAIRQVCETLLKKNIIPIIIGGSQDLTFAQYQSYENLEQVVNLVNIDSSLDFGEEGDLNSGNYLRNIVLHKPNYLFNFCNIGHQRPLVKGEDMELLEKMYFDSFRMGDIFNSVYETEPFIRNADILSFDISAIRFSDAPGNAKSSPNGLYAEQACQMSKYAGISDKLTSFGIYEYNPELDIRSSTGELIAEMIWYFIDGFSHRKQDYPIGSKDDYIKYIVPLERDGYELVFYKSPRSDRWWMDVPYTAGKKNKYQRHHLVPCSYSDYQKATNDDMPDLWWKTYQKLA